MALREIGSAFIRLFVKKDELSAGLKAAEAEVAASAQNMVGQVQWVSTQFDSTANVVVGSARRASGGVTRATNSATNSIKGFGKSLGDAFSPVKLGTSVLGIVSAIGAITAAAAAAIKALTDMSGLSESVAANAASAMEASRRARASMEGLYTGGPAEAEMQTLNKSIEEVSESIESTLNPMLSTPGEFFQKSIQYVTGNSKAIADAQKGTLRSLTDERRRLEDASEEEMAAKRRQAIIDASKDELAAMKKRKEVTEQDINDAAEIEAEAKKKIADANAKIHAERMAQINAEIQAELDGINRIRALRQTVAGMGGGISGDIRALNGVVKQLVDLAR